MPPRSKASGTSRRRCPTTSHWWIPFTTLPVLGPLGDKAIDLILAFFVFRALSREARRYREAVAARQGSYVAA